MNGRLKLVQVASEQAQHFMRETGGLLPFAIVLDNEEDVKQLMLDWKENHPNAREIAAAFEAVIKVRLRFNPVFGGVVCTDMLYKAHAQADKKDALGMKLLTQQETEYYFQTHVADSQLFISDDIVRADMK